MIATDRKKTSHRRTAACSHFQHCHGLFHHHIQRRLALSSTPLSHAWKLLHGTCMPSPPAVAPAVNNSGRGRSFQVYTLSVVVFSSADAALLRAVM